MLPSMTATAGSTWEGDRWLDDEWVPFIDALADALREEPAWEAQGFRAVRVLSFAGWHHLNGSEASLGLFEPETVEDTKIVLLTRTLPEPDGRTYYAAVPIPDARLDDGGVARLAGRGAAPAGRGVRPLTTPVAAKAPRGRGAEGAAPPPGASRTAPAAAAPSPADPPAPGPWPPRRSTHPPCRRALST